MASEFFENYKHPKWQAKRLRIMERDNFSCRKCGSKEKTLNVHHTYYMRKAKPWEYPDESLVTMCEPCHAECTLLMDACKKLIGRNWERLLFITGFLAAMDAERCGEFACGPHTPEMPGFEAYKRASGGVKLRLGVDHRYARRRARSFRRKDS